jgi:hypothetical protein
MRASAFDEAEFFRAIQASGARAILIGRRALVLLGLPVLTADYDFWIAIDDAEAFNRALGAFELQPTHTPESARRRGRYTLENDERIDVIVARSVSTVDGQSVAFDDLWSRRQHVMAAPGVPIVIPSIDDLILTKRFASRPRDAEDIRLLRALKEERGV